MMTGKSLDDHVRHRHSTGGSPHDRTWSLATYLVVAVRRTTGAAVQAPCQTVRPLSPQPETKPLKTLRHSVQTLKEHPRRFEFYLRDLDNHVLVESTAHSVVVRATRDNCSERRKAFFIREISAEGYIPDGYQSEPAARAVPSVDWIIDGSWQSAAFVHHPGSTFMVRLLVCGALLWAGLLTLLFLGAY